MSEEIPAVRAIVVAHGRLSDGLIDSVRSITGIGEDAIEGITNSGKSPDALVVEVRNRLGTGPCLIFTDMQAGSCAFTARRLYRERGDIAVVTGVNLPMLVDFAMHRALPLEELVTRLVARGREGITSTNLDQCRDADRPVPRR
ncbi:MAG: PTS sugar transporter subunit IIA [Longimicrobiales bacterium]